METRSNRFLVLMVLGLLLGSLLLFTFWLLAARGPDGNSYLIRFSGSVAGLKKGSPVTFSGVPAGRVMSVGFDKDDPSAVLVTISLDPGLPVVAGVKATVMRSFLGGTANLGLDGARPGAPPIQARPGDALPTIPAKEGGLLGNGGDPVALVDKISRTVDAVSRNLDATQQERVSDHLAALAEQSAAWSTTADRYADRLLSMKGRVLRVGNSLAMVGRNAATARKEIAAGRERPLRSVSLGSQAIESGAATFGKRLEVLRPTLRSAAGRQHAIAHTLRVVRAKTIRIRDGVQRLGQGGSLSRSSLPDYRPRGSNGESAAITPGKEAATSATLSR